jgi:3-hydroxymyristoyl/3-hydroxydecanoyl-(acyl carrier protein) dehydratase
MSPEELTPIVRKLRRGPVASLTAPAQSAHARAEIEQFVPHRGSMLLLDSIDYVDASARALRARRRIDPNDPVFEGHFPNNPVYPGVLLVEMMGQAGLCLLPLLAEGRSAHVARLTHVHHATFMAPVLPGAELTVLAGLVDDSLTLTAVGQIYHGETLCAFAASEVYVDE